MMIPEAQTPWQRRRAALNHDWLKNRFLTALDATQNMLSGRAHGDAYLAYLIDVELPDWEGRRSDVSQLLNDFEAEMSPAVLLDYPPLAKADRHTKQRCKELLRELWLSRYPVTNWVEAARQAFHEADSAYDRLRNIKICLDARPRSPEMIAALAEFRQCCHALAKAIESFPSTILVV